MVETTEETAYQIAVTNLTTAIDSANLPVTEKDHLTNVLQRMDTEAGSVAEFANTTIEILGYARDNAPELFPLVLEALARAASYYKVYW